jgi:hypothetical protein
MPPAFRRLPTRESMHQAAFEKPNRESCKTAAKRHFGIVDWLYSFVKTEERQYTIASIGSQQKKVYLAEYTCTPQLTRMPIGKAFRWDIRDPDSQSGFNSTIADHDLRIGILADM